MGVACSFMLLRERKQIRSGKGGLLRDLFRALRSPHPNVRKSLVVEIMQVIFLRAWIGKVSSPLRIKVNVFEAHSSIPKRTIGVKEMALYQWWSPQFC